MCQPDNHAMNFTDEERERLGRAVFGLWNEWRRATPDLADRFALSWESLSQEDRKLLSSIGMQTALHVQDKAVKAVREWLTEHEFVLHVVSFFSHLGGT